MISTLLLFINCCRAKDHDFALLNLPLTINDFFSPAVFPVVARYGQFIKGVYIFFLQNSKLCTPCSHWTVHDNKKKLNSEKIQSSFREPVPFLLKARPLGLGRRRVSGLLCWAEEELESVPLMQFVPTIVGEERGPGRRRRGRC